MRGGVGGGGGGGGHAPHPRVLTTVSRKDNEGFVEKILQNNIF